VIARVALVAVAAAVIVGLGLSRKHQTACDAARTTIFQVTLGHQPAARQPAAIQQVEDSCRGTTGLVAVAGALHRQGRDRAALAVAQKAAVEEPDNAAAWSAVEATAAIQAPALARAADARLAVLDPLSRPSLNRSTGRSTR